MDNDAQQIGFQGLSPVTAELVGEISKLTVALIRAEHQLKAAREDNAALRRQLDVLSPNDGA